jgi:GT2 family glycosyltransferase
MNDDYTITFACYNQLDYTKKFIQSLDREEVDFSRIVAVDNGSSDGTPEWLKRQGFGHVILNKKNLGCGVAWNQGTLALQSKWTVVMNNDVICAKGWLKNLITQAELNNLRIASPAMVEGAFNYDLSEWTDRANEKMTGYCRVGTAHAVCMAIHEDVWTDIGYFMPVPKLFGYEDAIFFKRSVEKDIKMGTVGTAWLHHYGMTTQKALKLEKHLAATDSLGDRDLMKIFLGDGWLERKLHKLKQKRLGSMEKIRELREFGITVHSVRIEGEPVQWR